MGSVKLGWGAIARTLLLSAAVFFVGRASLAQVNGFVVVNPIVVCDSNGANCPPFGMQCSTNTTTGAYSCIQSNSPSAATVNTPIGYVDGDTSFNLTRAILAAQAGIDVAFFPVQQYNSPINVDPWPTITPAYSSVSSNYQHLHLRNVTCKDKTIVLASPDLAALTQHQICTEHKGVPAGVSNPPPAPSPPPPLGSTLGESNALDVLFVTDFDQPVFGNSWINGDGVSIAGPAAFLVSAPRFDNLAHEIGHALALDHTTYGAGQGNNLMTTGSSRFVPSSSGCSITTPLGTSTNPFPNPNGGVLYDLFDPSVYPSTIPMLFGQPTCPPFPTNPPKTEADQLITGSPCTDLTTCTNQVGVTRLSPFINKTLASTAVAGGGTQAPIAGAATTNAATINTSSSSSAISVTVNASAGTGEGGDSINSIIIALPDINGLTFSGSSPATQTGGTGGVNIISQQRLNGNSGIGNPNCVKSINLAPPSVECLQIFFSTGGAQGNAFVAGDSVTFTLALNKDSGTIIQNDLLAGTQFTLVTSTVNTPTAYSTTTTFGHVCPPQSSTCTPGVFQADSRFPDFTTPNQISPNFINASVVQLGPDLSKCTPPYTGSGSSQQCPGGSLPLGPD